MYTLITSGAATCGESFSVHEEVGQDGQTPDQWYTFTTTHTDMLCYERNNGYFSPV